MSSRKAPKVPPKSKLRKSRATKGLEALIAQEEDATLLLQSWFRYLPPRRSYASVRKMHRHRTRVAQEILSTEETYVKHIRQLVKLFVQPLSCDSKLMDSGEVRVVFSNVEVLLNLNEMLLGDLQARLNDWNPNQKLGDIFCQLNDFFKMYVDYVSNYNDALVKLEACRSCNSKLDAFVKATERKIPGHLDLPSLLIMPVQRIPRYNLLLRDLIKNTWEHHPDYEELTSASDRMQSTAAYVNDKAKEADNLGKVLSIQNSLVGKFDRDLVSAQRRFVREGELMEWSREKKKAKPVYCILFNDLLVVAKHETRMMKKTQKFEYKARIPLESTKVALLKEGTVNYIENAFKVVPKKGEIILVADSPGEMADWFRTLDTATQEAAERARFLDEKKTELAREKAKHSKALLANKYRSMKRGGGEYGSAGNLTEGSEGEEEADGLPSSTASDPDCSVPRMRKFTLKKKRMTAQELYAASAEAEENLASMAEQDRQELEVRQKAAEERAQSAREQISQKYKSMKSGDAQDEEGDVKVRSFKKRMDGTIGKSSGRSPRS